MNLILPNKFNIPYPVGASHTIGHLTPVHNNSDTFFLIRSNWLSFPTTFQATTTTTTATTTTTTTTVVAIKIQVKLASSLEEKKRERDKECAL